MYPAIYLRFIMTAVNDRQGETARKKGNLF